MRTSPPVQVSAHAYLLLQGGHDQVSRSSSSSSQASQELVATEIRVCVSARSVPLQGKNESEFSRYYDAERARVHRQEHLVHEGA